MLVVGLGSLAAILLWLAVLFVPFDPGNLQDPAISTIVFDRHGRPLRAYLGNDDRWRIPVRLSEISPWVVKATVAVEDKRFRSHGGIDFRAIGRALLLNLKGGRIVSGASTLSMQVAGLTESRERTFFRKFRQAFRALQLERCRTKDQILELYLTNVPYGGNVCGIEAAARRYFGKGASDLTLSEASLLAGIPQSPSRLRPDKSLDATLKRREHVLARMAEEGVISRDDYDRAVKSKPTIGNYGVLQEAPHFCDYVRTKFHGSRITSTLDLDVQREAESVLQAQLAKLAPQGVTNGSLVVIDNASGDILAMVGSSDYASEANHGQVNGATASRSPGSALKPLIYAYAYQSGNLLPSTMLYDVPQQYVNYEPENFDRTFRGLVPADKALAWSLNVPAIQVLNETGVDRCLRFMRDAGLDTLQRPAMDYGLSLAIGSCGVQLLELTNAYAMLARGGVWKPSRAVLQLEMPRPGTTASLSVRGDAPRLVLSEQACYFVNHALSDVALRPPEGVDPELIGLKGVAWKTGTSNGFHDAWTVGYDHKYTVGVWIGNMDGRPSRVLVGSRAAAPVALSLLKWLKQDGRGGDSTWPARPPGVGRIIVCAETGCPANDNCPTTHTAECISRPMDAGLAASSPPPCSVHKLAWIDVETSQQLCARCIEGRKSVTRSVAVWPTAVQAWMRQNNAGMELPPVHYTGCKTAARGPSLKITSPRHGDSFVLTSLRNPGAQKLSLEAAAPIGSHKLYWFVDGELVTTADAGQPAYIEPPPGQHTLRCADDYGRSDWACFSVTKE